MTELPEVYQAQPAVPVADGVAIRPTGLVITRELDYGEWSALGVKLRLLEKAIQFAIGDWLNYGNARYGETYTQAVEETGYSVGSLMNMKFVASRIEPSRRREALSFSHHAEVAGLPPSEQELWLNAAEHEGWTRQQLRDALHPDVDELFDTLECPNCGYQWEAE